VSAAPSLAGDPAPQPLADIVQKSLEIPAMPEIADKLVRLADDPRAKIPELSKIVEADAAVSSAILRIVNSSFYGFTHKVSEIRQAIPMLGLAELKNLVIAVATRTLYKRFGPAERKLWHHSFESACACRVICALFAKPFRDTAFLAGQLHDVGSVVITTNDPAFYETKIGRIDNPQILDDERAAFGFDHTAAGALLVRRWNMPPAVETAARYHHDLPLAVVQAADFLPLVAAIVVSEFIMSATPKTAPNEQVKMACEALRIPLDTLPTLVEQIRPRVESEKAGLV
jgi:HD-like signal output (HDOD) protein